MAKQVLEAIENTMKKAIEATKRELAELRSGRANPKMVEGIRVNYYGTPTLLKELATIGVPEARMVVIHPYDPTSLKEIEKAILQSELGITPVCDGKLLRLIVPPLSEERRQDLIKIVKKVIEEGKVSVRTVRRDGKEEIKQFEKDKKISEDERFQSEEELQKLTDKYIKDLDKILEEKEKELKEF
ncbi:MAG: ribosome recycling factor [Candidatus Omnitrophica bacterium]|nr:ribosome recycling factor [Candidatus Omnitrophota bacterium]MBU2044179.1 ribosome recycling factor [Candidatus Omnitrophota bacterium]MBU2251033.1 ribosome recycling factor [Candidatus Omnitrophota bacterium]MBU2473511.1 ribosome recycling factor [Candidatus Omnitrophota bacterium]